MIPYPGGPHDSGDDDSFLRTLLTAVPRTYAIVFYSTDVRFGWFLAAVSLLVKGVGLAGLLGIVGAAGLAWLLGVDRGWIRAGFVLFNPLLACSAVAALSMSNGWTAGAFSLFWLVSLSFSLFLTVALQGWVASRAGLSVQSLPAVITVALVSWGGFAAGGYFPQVNPGAVPAAEWIGLPGHIGGFFRAFGALVFHESDIVGIMVYTAFAMFSPIGAFMASVGYVSGAAAFAVLGLPVDPTGTAWCGFGFLLAGVALGAGYQVPNRSSILLAAGGGAVCAVVALGLSVGMGMIHLLPGALPYNLVVISTVAALRLLPRASGLIPSPWIVLQPEAVARVSQVTLQRFPHLSSPAIFLPVGGDSVVTQGFSGDLTHRGPWKHALDFETLGEFGSWNPTSALAGEYGIFGRAVHCPASGTVVEVENSVDDNPVGGNNPEKNWGNYVITRTDFGTYVMLAHFLKGSVAVEDGQRVREGDYFGLAGSSGRSPLPHLHAHVQSGPLPGSSTIPFVLKHYVEVGAAGSGSVYRTAGVPAKNTIVRPAVPSHALYQSLSGWLPGTYRYLENGQTRHELVVDFDEAGRFRLSEPRSGGTITAHISEGVLYSSTYGGTSGGILALIGIALARVPCIEEPNVTWHDSVAAVPFMLGWRKWLHDLLDPFANPAILHYQYRLKNSARGHEISATLCGGGGTAGRAPLSLQATILGRRGVSSIHGRRIDGGEFRYEMERT